MQKVVFPVHRFGLENVDIHFEANFSPSRFIPVTGLANDYSRPDQPDFYSPLGLPVYGSLILGSNDPNNPKKNEFTGVDGKTYNYETITLSIAVITVNMVKEIIKTGVTGRPGKIKEYIALDDFDITIQSVFTAPAGKAPKSDVNTLHALAIAAVPIPVTSYFLNQFGIYHIVIESATYPQEQGGYSWQDITIRACSDYQEDELYP